MKSLLTLVLVVAATASLASAAVFTSTVTGSMDVRVDTEGYANSGASGTPRMLGGGGTRSNWGFTSFYGATSGGQSLSQFLTANPGATATLYVCVNSTIAANVGALETIRSGNSGALVADGATGTGFAYAAPAAGTPGSSQATAFRMGALDNGAGYLANGDFGAGTAWITPAGRTGAPGITGDPTTAGQPITYANPGTGYQVGGGLENRQKGQFAFADLVGMWGGNNQNGTTANVTAAGQYLNGGNTTPSLFGSGNIVALDSQGRTAPGGYAWLAIPVDATLLNDMANNDQCKGLLFNNAVSGVGITVDGTWDTFQGNNSNRPYLDLEPVPEPATLGLLLVGGIGALLKRRK